MTLHAFLLWLQATAPAQAIAQSSLLFPLVEVIHVLSLAVVVGSIGTFDLRMLGLAWRKRPVETLAIDILPWTWSAFALALLSGGLMFSSAAVRYAANPPFQFKLGLLALAGLNMAVFHVLPYRRTPWETDRTPLPLQASAGLSLLIWCSVVVLGRWIAFV